MESRMTLMGDPTTLQVINPGIHIPAHSIYAIARVLQQSGEFLAHFPGGLDDVQVTWLLHWSIGRYYFPDILLLF
jgi:hypothetical protein